MITRRNFLATTASACGYFAMQAALPAWARSSALNNMHGLKALSGTEYNLNVSNTPLAVDGKLGNAITVNGQMPAPLLRWREGDEITLSVSNNLAVDTSIHWHGILLPFQMDGVPGVSFPGIKPNETFTYRFPVRQAGTYWYHSHSGLQEQSGHYGPIIIDPIEPDPVKYDREYVIVLSDWTFEDPHTVFSNLKKKSHIYNTQKPTIGDFLDDAKKMGLGESISERAMWGGMRMNPGDIADVTGATYYFLMNGHSANDNWTALFNPGERIRLRFINAAAMTFFNVRIPGLPMTVVQADGLNVEPVETDEFQFSPAETYDVIIEPKENTAYTLMCESSDRSGYVSGTIAPRAGMTAQVPVLRAPPKLTMADMGMKHGEEVSGHEMPSHDMSGHDMSGHSMPEHSMSGHGMNNHIMPDKNNPAQEHNHKAGFGVANLVQNPQNRLAEPGVGLENVPHRTLTYAQLRSLDSNPDHRAPERELEIHLTGNMERYMWSLDGLKFSEITEPIIFHENERLRMTLVNDTMMPHPIHLHGMFFDVVNGQAHNKPRKHTITVKPAEKLSIDITANEPGDWAFHCHLMYHMHAGMMQVVSVKPNENNKHEKHIMPKEDKHGSHQMHQHGNMHKHGGDHE